MSRTYGGLIWTNHALDRLKERQFGQDKALSAYLQPDSVKPGRETGTREYRRKLGYQTVTLIVADNREGEKVVVSCWIDPPFYGTKDYHQKKRYREYQAASPLKKIWLIVKEQLGF